MILVDSHCHLDRLELAPYQGDLSNVLAEAAQQGVRTMLTVSVDIDSFPAVHAIAKRYEQVFCSVGLHPTEQLDHEPSEQQLFELAQQDKVIAVGETGLDYYHIQGDVTWQQERFRRHIRVARSSGKPLIIHSRQAPEDTIRIMHEEKADTIGGVMHCFTESWEVAEQAMELGFYISLSGIVTFKNATTLHDVAKRVPLERLLVETDAPYLAPVPHRGQSNYPAYVRHTAARIAELRGIPLEQVAEQTTHNFFKLFTHAKG